VSPREREYEAKQKEKAAGRSRSDVNWREEGTMSRIATGLVIIGAVAFCLGSLSASRAANNTDLRFVWPKNSQFNCSGVLAEEDGTYRLKPDQGMLAWCDADIDNKDKGGVLRACKLGDRCEIEGTIRGHGAFGWVEITSVKAVLDGPQPDKCSGILHKDKYGLRFGGGNKEGEGICLVNQSDEQKVLAICTVGHFCEASGLVDNCKDSGECVELTNITSVKRAGSR
jgi:hypothetical protein